MKRGGPAPAGLYDTFARTPERNSTDRGETTSAYGPVADPPKPASRCRRFRHYLQSGAQQGASAPTAITSRIYTHNELLTTYRGDIGGKNGLHRCRPKGT